jgi:hypothetical protein
MPEPAKGPGLSWQEPIRIGHSPDRTAPVQAGTIAHEEEQDEERQADVLYRLAPGKFTTWSYGGGSAPAGPVPGYCGERRLAT